MARTERADPGCPSCHYILHALTDHGRAGPWLHASGENARRTACLACGSGCVGPGGRQIAQAQYIQLPGYSCRHAPHRDHGITSV